MSRAVSSSRPGCRVGGPNGVDRELPKRRIGWFGRLRATLSFRGSAERSAPRRGSASDPTEKIMEVTLVHRSIYALPSNQRVGCIVYDGAGDMQLWPGPGPDLELTEHYGDTLQRALDTELRQIEGRLLPIPSSRFRALATQIRSRRPKRRLNEE